MRTWRGPAGGADQAGRRQVRHAARVGNALAASLSPWKSDTPFRFRSWRVKRSPLHRTMSRCQTVCTTGVFAGTMGIPLIRIVFGIANAVQALFGDDEPWDAETEFRNFLADYGGAGG